MGLASIWFLDLVTKMKASSELQNNYRRLNHRTVWLYTNTYLLTASLILVFLLALGVRLYNSETPSRIPTREFHSELIARWFYYEIGRA